MDFIYKLTVLCGLILTLFLTSKPNTFNSTGEDQNSNTIEIMALHDHKNNLHLFDMSTNEVSSGWTTFAFTNASDSDHFAVIYKVPDAAIVAADEAGEELLDHWYNSVTAPFQEEYNHLTAGSVDYETFVNNLITSISNNGPWILYPERHRMEGRDLHRQVCLQKRPFTWIRAAM